MLRTSCAATGNERLQLGAGGVRALLELRGQYGSNPEYFELRLYPCDDRDWACHRIRHDGHREPCTCRVGHDRRLHTGCRAGGCWEGGVLGCIAGGTANRCTPRMVPRAFHHPVSLRQATGYPSRDLRDQPDPAEGTGTHLRHAADAGVRAVRRSGSGPWG